MRLDSSPEALNSSGSSAASDFKDPLRSRVGEARLLCAAAPVVRPAMLNRNEEEVEGPVEAAGCAGSCCGRG